jgi:hypothetical protein
MLTTELREYLLTLTEITTLVGQNIAPIPAPTDLSHYPMITYQQASDLPEYSLDGPEGLATSRIVFNCLAQLNPGGYLKARNIALALRTALSGYAGTLPGGTRVWFTSIANVQDVFNDQSFLSCTSVHALVTYDDSN